MFELAGFGTDGVVWLQDENFPSHARLVQSLPFARPYHGLLGPDKLRWPHPKDPRPYPTGGSWTWHTLQMLSGPRPSNTTEFDLVSAW